MTTRTPKPSAVVATEDPVLLKVPEVATLLRTTSDAIYAQVERGQLPGVVRLGRRVLFSRAALLAWIEAKTEKAK